MIQFTKAIILGVFLMIGIVSKSIGQKAALEVAFLKVDSLVTANDTTAIKVLEEIAQNFPDELSKKENFIFYHKLQGDFYAWVIQDYPKGIRNYKPLTTVSRSSLDSTSLDRLAKGLNDMGIIYKRMGELDSAISIHQKSLNIYQEIGSQQGLAYNYNNLGIIYRTQRKMDSAMQFFDKSCAASEAIKDTLGIGYNYLNLASGAVNQEQLSKAIDYYNRALDMFRKGKYEKRIATTLFRMSNFYYRLSDHEQALILLRQARDYYEENPNKSRLQSIYLRFANSFVELEQLDSASHYVEKTKEVAGEAKISRLQINILQLEARIHKKRKEFISSIKKYEQAIEACEDKYLSQRIAIQTGLADVLLEAKSYTKVVSLVENDILKADQDLLDERDLTQAYEALWKAHQALGNTKKALLASSKYIVLLETQKSRKRNYQLAKAEYQLTVEQNKAKAEALRQAEASRYERQLLEVEYRQYLTMGGSLFLALVVGLLIYFYRIKRKDNALLRAQAENLNLRNEELRVMREKEAELSKREQEHLRFLMQTRERELSATTLRSHEKNSLLEELLIDLQTLTPNGVRDVKTVDQLKRTIRENLSQEDSWEQFVYRFERVHPNFFQQLRKKHPELTANDERLCAYLLIGFDNKEIAQVSGIAHVSVKKNINRLKKRMGLEGNDDLREFISQVV
ncbi:MAG: tetratricopeptide repeat protein [Bacteroidota bacterium]